MTDTPGKRIVFHFGLLRGRQKWWVEDEMKKNRFAQGDKNSPIINKKKKGNILLDSEPLATFLELTDIGILCPATMNITGLDHKGIVKNFLECALKKGSEDRKKNYKSLLGTDDVAQIRIEKKDRFGTNIFIACPGWKDDVYLSEIEQKIKQIYPEKKGGSKWETECHFHIIKGSKPNNVIFTFRMIRARSAGGINRWKTSNSGAASGKGSGAASGKGSGTASGKGRVKPKAVNEALPKAFLDEQIKDPNQTWGSDEPSYVEPNSTSLRDTVVDSPKIKQWTKDGGDDDWEGMYDENGDELGQHKGGVKTIRKKTQKKSRKKRKSGKKTHKKSRKNMKRKTRKKSNKGNKNRKKTLRL